MQEETIYLDNAATTWPKPEQVYEIVDQSMRMYGANPGRGAYKMAREADQQIMWARKDIARFFDMSDEKCVIFTSSATDALMTVIHGLIREGARVVTGPYEHNSVYRPLLSKQGIQLVFTEPDEMLGWNLEDLRTKCKDGIDFAVVSQASNVTGCAAPLHEIEEIVHRAGGILIVDGSQGAGVLPVSLRNDRIDIYCTAGHKGLMGPMGTGLLLVEPTISGKERVHIAPLREGGTGIYSEEPGMPEEYPYRLEAGTLNLSGILGLAEGVRFLDSRTIEAVRIHETKLADMAMQELAKLPEITIYGKCPADTGVFSFTVQDRSPEEVGYFLSEFFHIGVRTGLHCAPLAHQNLGTMPYGTVRVSFGQFNTEDDVRQLCAAVLQVVNQ